MADQQRIEHQLEFLVECDKLKGIERRTRPIGQQRQENSAEHSWDIALMAVVLAEHATEPVNLPRVIEMLLVHDIVEIDAGDTFLYDTAGQGDKREREERAAQRIFNLLPEDQANKVRALWDEFEERATAEAKFAAAVDRLTGMLKNVNNEGGTWRQHGLGRAQVMAWVDGVIRDGSPALAEQATRLVETAVARGWLKED